MSSVTGDDDNRPNAITDEMIIEFHSKQKVNRGVVFVTYDKVKDSEDKNLLGQIMKLMEEDLSEPYSIYTYYYWQYSPKDRCS